MNDISVLQRIMEANNNRSVKMGAIENRRKNKNEEVLIKKEIQEQDEIIKEVEWTDLSEVKWIWEKTKVSLIEYGIKTKEDLEKLSEWEIDDLDISKLSKIAIKKHLQK